jgi:hypothetical protein
MTKQYVIFELQLHGFFMGVQKQQKNKIATLRQMLKVARSLASSPAEGALTGTLNTNASEELPLGLQELYQILFGND